MERCLACEAVVSRERSSGTPEFSPRSTSRPVLILAEGQSRTIVLVPIIGSAHHRPRQRGSAPRVAAPSACLRLRVNAEQLQVFWACDKDTKPDFAPSSETPRGYVGQAAI
jgi:hypothetical protein